MTSSVLYDFTIVSRSGYSDQSDSSNLTFKNFPRGSMPPDPPRWVRLWRTGTPSAYLSELIFQGPMLHSDPGPTNSLRGPDLQSQKSKIFFALFDPSDIIFKLKHHCNRFDEILINLVYQI